MLRYALSRLVQLVVMLVVASIVVFMVIRLAPGDPAAIRLGLDATQAQIAVERQRLGLDEPLSTQYLLWMWSALRLDFGDSFATGLPVTEVIGTAMYYTAVLALSASLAAVALGVLLGITAALNRGNRVDLAISALASGGFSVPSFALGTLLILLLSVRLRLLPPSGAEGQTWAELLPYLVLPTITLAVPVAVVLTRFIRVALGESMSQPHVVTAHALGLRRRTIVLKHGVRNAMIPTVTVLGIHLGQLLAGAAVTETVFSYPGLGRLTVQSVEGRDYPVVQGALLLGASVFLLVTFVVDIAYGLIDPRIRLGGKV